MHYISRECFFLPSSPGNTTLQIISIQPLFFRTSKSPWTLCRFETMNGEPRVKCINIWLLSLVIYHNRIWPLKTCCAKNDSWPFLLYKHTLLVLFWTINLSILLNSWNCNQNGVTCILLFEKTWGLYQKDSILMQKLHTTPSLIYSWYWYDIYLVNIIIGNNVGIFPHS